MSPLRSTVGVVTVYDGLLGVARKLPGRPDTAAVSLEREVSDDLAFDIWARGPQLRKEVRLTVSNPSGVPRVTYRMHECWVSEYAVTPDVETGLVLESVTLTMDSWERVVPPVSVLAQRLAVEMSGSVRRVAVGALLAASAQETESRVDALLRDAEGSSTVLLLDEADAIYSRRTQVEDAHDRDDASPVDALRSRLARFPGSVLVAPPDSPGPTASPPDA